MPELPTGETACSFGAGLAAFAGAVEDDTFLFACAMMASILLSNWSSTPL
jgi:hypothetical protein